MDNLYWIIGLALAFWAGWNIRGILILARLGSNPEHFIKILEQIKEINVKEEQNQDPDATELRIERVGNLLYAYRKEDNQFVAQGANLAELLESAAKRFPNNKFFGDIKVDNPAKEIA